MKSFPIFINLIRKPVLVVGGGDVALRKIDMLLRADASVTVVASKICKELQHLQKSKKIRVKIKAFDKSDVKQSVLIVAATDNKKVNTLVSKVAQTLNIPVNVVDEPSLCTFTMGSIIDRSPLLIAISSEGNAPVLAKFVREKIEALIPNSFGKLALVMGSMRDVIKGRYETTQSRRIFWENFIDHPLVRQFLNQTKKLTSQQLIALVKNNDMQKKQGEVFLVGGGPGDPDLLTFRALHLMQRADVCVYDKLISKDVLNLVRRDAELIYVGKERDRHTVSQEKINQLLVKLAVKGIGGFHLMADARDEAVVCRLRERKQREEKPFALMCASKEMAAELCRVSPFEERLLTAPEAPIVLLARLPSGAGSCDVAPAVAPGQPSLGVMLPYTPLHHWLLSDLARPLVATSGNLSEESICTSEAEAVARLSGVADFFLVHNRAIVRQVDDSVVRMMAGREMVLRRARGYAPLPMASVADRETVLGVGAQLKNTVALSVGGRVFLSQHIGDLDSLSSLRAFERVHSDLAGLYQQRVEVVALDLHPDYGSSRWARTSTLPLVPVQHHYAHVLACMAENELTGPVLGVAWDGTGLGSDGTIWGGEFLRVDDVDYSRVGHLRPFRLPGGDKAVVEPRRSALALLWEIYGTSAFELHALPTLRAFSLSELGILRKMLETGLNSPLTSSAGRLFDAVASLLGVRQQIRHEGQAAQELEHQIPLGVAVAPESTGPEGGSSQWSGGAAMTPPGIWVMDWEPLVRELLAGAAQGESIGGLSSRFHDGLADGIVTGAQRIGLERVVLTGGCFQNKVLLERTIARLSAAGFRPYWPQRVPANDGGISLGQVVAAARFLRRPDYVSRSSR